MLLGMRYLLAIAVALLLIAAVLGYAGWLKHAMNAELRAMLLELKSQGNLPAEFNPETATIADLQEFDTNLPVSLVNKLITYEVILRWLYVWVPAVILVCLGAAYLGPRSGTAR